MREITNYWSRKANRRRFLGGGVAAGAGVAGLALVGCGDDDGDTVESLATPTSGAAATATPADPFANAKKGGTYKLTATGDPPSLDPYGNASFRTKGFAAWHYSRLYMYKAGNNTPPASVRPTPDVAQTAESSPDGLKWTIKLRPGVKFQNVAPVNGRALSTDDVKFSFDRLRNSGNKNLVDFIDKVDYPDASTVVFTLKAPSAVFLDTLADTNALFIMPTESDGKFDPQKTAIGSGPWIFDRYQPSVTTVRKKNPDWWMTGFPLFDTVEEAIIVDYANRLAQFQAGGTDSDTINGDDLPDLKKAIPQVQLFGTLGPTLSILYFDNDATAPWQKDPRVRQAISMGLDRDALTELGYNIKKLRAAGLDVKTPYHNIIPAGETLWWLDPVGAAAGDGAKFFKYNVAEAKALLSAAGFPNGFEAKYQYTANAYTKTFNDIAEANIQFLNAIGVKTQTEVQDYNTTYINQTFKGNFKGIAFGYETPFPEAGTYLQRPFGTSEFNHGKVRDPQIDKYFEEQTRELNEEKRKAIFHEAQKYHATKMYYVPNQAGAGTTWTGHQPNVRNGVEYTVKGYGGGTEVVPFRWKA